MPRGPEESLPGGAWNPPGIGCSGNRSVGWSAAEPAPQPAMRSHLRRAQEIRAASSLPPPEDVSRNLTLKSESLSIEGDDCRRPLRCPESGYALLPVMSAREVFVSWPF